jgi:CRP-like cAMP-binding protein
VSGLVLNTSTKACHPPSLRYGAIAPGRFKNADAAPKFQGNEGGLNCKDKAMRLEEFLTQNTEQKKFGKGEIIFTEGTQAEAAYYILQGQVEIFKGTGKTSVGLLGPGQIFGEMALLRFNEYTLSARAHEDTVVHVIMPELLHSQIRATHPLIQSILNMLVDRVHELNEVLIDLENANRA